MKKSEKENIQIWGVKFSIWNLNIFVQRINEKIKHNSFPTHITGVNPETVVHASRNETIRRAILESDYVNIDNALIVLVLRVLGYKIPERVATPDLFEALLKLASDERYRVFILGAKESVLQTAIQNIKNDYPYLEIEGQDGYYSREKENEVIKKINLFAPDMLFIALPSPEKESFILKYKKEIKARLFLGVGGAIDCRAGVVKRPPQVLRNSGFEGIIRSFQNPLNYGKRYLTFYPAFFKIVIKSLFNKNNK
ncbi:N-acetylglucosaminyldiphosphoundecaprenol N-acetyl-beta-D-mannosaminyltransferase [bioreactor metagenome]|uniref:N-acetylglucosaminyldiphosphoundecaprenol N-acetyl-beta-D-mannosaminyltransferase n=1 Tax=bioreactor metagenome TaxID=1076179 RepID=A0A644WJ17_9ZZZZ|nr:WecB/TagA/CpsF family glycosyltransferase [Paludibacter sp.]